MCVIGSLRHLAFVARIIWRKKPWQRRLNCPSIRSSCPNAFTTATPSSASFMTLVSSARRTCPSRLMRRRRRPMSTIGTTTVGTSTSAKSASFHSITTTKTSTISSVSGWRMASVMTFETVVCSNCVSATVREIMSPARCEL